MASWDDILTQRDREVFDLSSFWFLIRIKN